MNPIEAPELNGAELEVGAGGMDCKTGTAASNFYHALADGMAAIGNYGRAIQFQAMGDGLKSGACD